MQFFNQDARKEEMRGQHLTIVSKPIDISGQNDIQHDNIQHNGNQYNNKLNVTLNIIIFSITISKM
jgi:hypothetical protein